MAVAAATAAMVAMEHWQEQAAAVDMEPPVQTEAATKTALAEFHPGFTVTAVAAAVTAARQTEQVAAATELKIMGAAQELGQLVNPAFAF